MISKVITLFEIALSKPNCNNNESFQTTNCRFQKTLVVIKKSSNINKICTTTKSTAQSGSSKEFAQSGFHAQHRHEFYARKLFTIDGFHILFGEQKARKT